MTRKTLSYLVPPVIAAVALLVGAEPAAAQHGGPRGGGGFQGGAYRGGVGGLHSNTGPGYRGYSYRPYFGYGFYPYDYGDEYGPDYYGYGPSPSSWTGPTGGYYPVPQLSGEFPAVLTLEFPAPAEVWLDGRKVEGEAVAVRTISSPILKPGNRYTFHIKAGWTVKGQTYAYNRDVTLETGARSRLLVLSGTPVTGR